MLKQVMEAGIRDIQLIDLCMFGPNGESVYEVRFFFNKTKPGGETIC